MSTSLFGTRSLIRGHKALGVRLSGEEDGFKVSKSQSVFPLHVIYTIEHMLSVKYNHKK